MNHRIAKYKEHQKAVIFVQHNDEELVVGTTPWEILKELEPERATYFIQKKYPNSFFDTNLDQLLTSIETKSIEVCGAQTEYCVDTTIKVAHGLGYKVRMKKGLSTTVDNQFMNAKATIDFYEGIWNKRFLEWV